VEWEVDERVVKVAALVVGINPVLDLREIVSAQSVVINSLIKLQSAVWIRLVRNAVRKWCENKPFE